MHLIVKKILLVSTLGNLERTVWRICIVMVECKRLKEWSNDIALIKSFPKTDPKFKSQLPSETCIASSKPVLLASDMPESGNTCSFSSTLITSIWKKRDINLKAKSVQTDAITILKHCTFSILFFTFFSFSKNSMHNEVVRALQEFFQKLI